MATDKDELVVLANDLRPYAEKAVGSIRIDVREVAKIVSALDRIEAADKRIEELEAALTVAEARCSDFTEATTLHVAEADKPLAFLELSDEALGRFARSYLIQIERAVHVRAGEAEMPLTLAMSMHGAIALYRMAAEANAGKLTLEHEDVEWGGKQRGNWSVTIRQEPTP